MACPASGTHCKYHQASAGRFIVQGRLAESERMYYDFRAYGWRLGGGTLAVAGIPAASRGPHTFPLDRRNIKPPDHGPSAKQDYAIPIGLFWIGRHHDKIFLGSPASISPVKEIGTKGTVRTSWNESLTRDGLRSYLDTFPFVPV
jgi:hypothetical protein